MPNSRTNRYPGGPPMPRHPAAHHPPFQAPWNDHGSGQAHTRKLQFCTHVPVSVAHASFPIDYAPHCVNRGDRREGGIREAPPRFFYNRHAPIVLYALRSVSLRIARGPTRYHRITNVLAHRRHQGDIRIIAFEINGFFPNGAHRSDPIVSPDRVRLCPRTHCDFSGGEAQPLSL